MNITNDENKSCLICKYSYIDDDLELVCEKSGKVCVIDMKNCRYGTCNEWRHEKD